MSIIQKAEEYKTFIYHFDPNTSCWLVRDNLVKDLGTITGLNKHPTPDELALWGFIEELNKSSPQAVNENAEKLAERHRACGCGKNHHYKFVDEVNTWLDTTLTYAVLSSKHLEPQQLRAPYYYEAIHGNRNLKTIELTQTGSHRIQVTYTHDEGYKEKEEIVWSSNTTRAQLCSADNIIDTNIIKEINSYSDEIIELAYAIATKSTKRLAWKVLRTKINAAPIQELNKHELTQLTRHLKTSVGKGNEEKLIQNWLQALKAAKS